MLKSFIQNRISWMMALAFLFTAFSTGYAAQITVVLSTQPAAFNGQCPALIKFIGKITVSEPIKLQYQFVRNDGISSPLQTLNFIKPGSLSVSASCILEGSKPPIYEGWAVIKITSPQQVQSNRVQFKVQCNENMLNSPGPSTRAPVTGKTIIVKPWVLSGLNPQPEPPAELPKIGQPLKRDGINQLNPQPEPPKPELKAGALSKSQLTGPNPTTTPQYGQLTGKDKRTLASQAAKIKPYARLEAPNEGVIWETGGIYSVGWSSFNITPGSYGMIVCQRLAQSSSSGNKTADFYSGLNNTLDNLPFLKMIATNIALSGKVSFRTTKASELDLKKFPIGSLVDMVLTLSFQDKKTDIHYEDSRTFKLRITESKGQPAQKLTGSGALQAPVTKSEAAIKALEEKNKIVKKEINPEPAAYFLLPEGTVEWAPGSTHTISWACTLPPNKVKGGELRIACAMPKMPGQGPQTCDYFSSTILKPAAAEGEISYIVPSYGLLPNEKVLLGLFLKFKSTIDGKTLEDNRMIIVKSTK